MAVNKEINIPSLLKIGRGKISKIGKYLSDRGYVKAALFFGDGIEEIVASALYSGFEINGIETVHRDIIKEINIESVIHTAFKIPSDTNVLLGIGGGKALDYSKYCAHVLKLPYISVPTSVSNDGFCSPNASLLVAGKRKSVKSSIPYGVVVDLAITSASPVSYLYSGLGDMISKVTALWDWKSAFQKGFEEHNDFASLISHNSLDVLYSGMTEKISSDNFQYKLVNSLLLSGIAMEIAGSSRPASGSEHLISHALDAVCKTPHMHGMQVGVAAYLCALLQGNKAELVSKFLSDTGFVEYVAKAPLSKADFIEALKIAPSIKQGYYTILSEADSFSRALAYIESDPILKKLIK